MNSRGVRIPFYYCVSDCNKVPAVATAVATFLFFLNLHLRYSKIINQMAAATFGVLLIHANSDTMRQWLWKDTLNNVGMYGSEMLVFHACFSVLAVYIVCMLLDVVRIHLLEGPVMRQMERMIDNIGLNNYSEKS